MNTQQQPQEQQLVPVTTDPNAVIIASMIETLGKAMVQGLTEPERIKAAEETRRAELRAGVEKLGLLIAAGIVGLILVLAAAAFFFANERTLLVQAIPLVIGFLGGMGFTRFQEPKK